MVIEKLEIKNFRDLKEQTIHFEKDLNLFIGGNGSGKTSLLDAIIKCLYFFTSRLASSGRSLILNTNDINYDKIYYQLKAYVNSDQFEMPDFIGLAKGELDPASKTAQSNSENQIYQMARSFRKIFENKIFDAIPIIKLYPANRGRVKYVALNKNEKVYITPQLETWENIYHNDLSYSRFLTWFFEHETNELRLKRDKEDLKAESPELKYVRFAIEKAVKLIYGKNYKIKSNQRKIEGSNKLIPTISLQKEGGKDSENSEAKSDGERTVIILIADIAYNLSIAHNFNVDEDCLTSPGIVLIDEIEAHLHPNWQRKVIGILRALFPNIQFFITTHSPQVLSSVNSNNVFLCDNFNVEKINFKSQGVDSNSLLKYVFNSTERPKKYIDLLKKFDAFVEAEEEISKLQSIINEIAVLENEDQGNDISLLMAELQLKLEAYKFDMENEVN